MGTGFVLPASACPGIKQRLRNIPVPRAFVVSGRLDEIGHGSRRFRLLVEGGSLPGRLTGSGIDVELLRPLWGGQATVQGVVHFKASGEPRFMEAHRISPRAEGDRFFAAMPEAERAAALVGDSLSTPKRTRPASRVEAIGRVDPMVLWGTWPGDEPIEELLAQLNA